MTKIKLTKAIMVKGVETKEVELDFEKLTARDMLQAEKEARISGDNTPSLLVSMSYQSIIAAKLIGILPEDLQAVPAKDFRNIIMPVANFLLGAE